MPFTDICTRPECQTTAGCQCNRIGRYSFTPNEPFRGWLCPQCGRAHAPHVVTCPERSNSLGALREVKAVRLGGSPKPIGYLSFEGQHAVEIDKGGSLYPYGQNFEWFHPFAIWHDDAFRFYRWDKEKRGYVEFDYTPPPSRKGEAA